MFRSLAVVAFALVAGCAGGAAQWDSFGGDFTVATSIQADALLDGPEAFVDKTVRVEGEIADVCQKKGCWMVLRDAKDRNVRIRMADHGFGVDMDSTGRWADLEGKVVVNEPNADEAAHFASEANNPDAAPKGEGKQKTYEIIATAVRVKKG